MGRLLAAHKGTVLAIVLLQLVQTTASLLLPTLNAAIIDDGIVGGDVPAILRLGSWMAAIALVQVVAAIAAGYLGAVAAMELGRELRAELFAKVQSMSSQEVGGFGAASLGPGPTKEVAQIQNSPSLLSPMWFRARP
ncbi:ABC transporter transmembrane domain-containing protein, partial [uncultured Arthrobacter sp.]|uniref:ABC transporter transmembrane domain-containing protein n=1 Tax=uncultured Arthrobacter sp. TaxID=114050 RepID=UPI0032171805